MYTHLLQNEHYPHHFTCTFFRRNAEKMDRENKHNVYVCKNLLLNQRLAHEGDTHHRQGQRDDSEGDER